MLLNELFDDKPEGGVVQQLRDAILDMLTPIASQGVPQVSIQSIIDKMSSERSGIAIDRAMVMHVLDPQAVKMVKKIEGDVVHLISGDEEEYAASEDQEEKDQQHVKNMATQQAKKSVTDTGPSAPTPDVSGDSPF